MWPKVTDDPILRENRRSELARRLISHGVRTKLITQLTGLTRNRLATVRRRLMVKDKARPRGPARSSLEIFLGTPQARSEGAALVFLCSAFEIPIELNAPSLPATASLSFTERLCETYEAFRAFFPTTEIELEELILLRSSIENGDEVRSAKCRVCKGLILIAPFEGARRACAVCDAKG
jgi:hypothetical protein